MIEIIRTNSQNLEFEKLVNLQNSDLASGDGETHPLSQFNNISSIKYVVLVMKKDKAIGCGSISKYDNNSMEIKRMYVFPEARGQRIGEKILSELENWSRELGNTKCLLFMGSKQPEVSKLYQRNNYDLIDKYGELKDIPDSLCFAITFTSCSDDDDMPNSAKTFLENAEKQTWKYVDEYGRVEYLMFKNNQKLPFEWWEQEDPDCYWYFDLSYYEIEVLENSATNLTVNRDGSDVYKFRIEGDELIMLDKFGDKNFIKTNDNPEDVNVCSTN